MSISEFFNKKIVTQKSLEAVTASAESPDLIKQVNKRNRTYYPNVDFADPSSFVHFGSAKEYYEGSIKRIYQQYPYDGSEAEKMEFDLNSTYLDRWLFTYKYPKSTGYALFSADGWGTPASTVGKYGIPNNKEYIFSAGGMHSASITQHEDQDNPIANHALKSVFNLGVKYDADKNRTINYRMNMTDGITIQFWLKKDAFKTSNGTDKEVILDLWNGNEQGQHNYGRLTLELSGGLSNPTTGSTIILTLMSGTFGISNEAICETTYNAAAVANGQWQHHTITAKAANSNLNVNYYNNGLLNKANSFSTTRNLLDVPNNINGYIGSLQTASFADHSSYPQNMLGAGKLSASMDDFRFWKTSLDNEYIYNTWYYPIGGGSNTDDYRTNLGVYYKFNEGITGTASVDSIVLDYSGRIANGVWYKQSGFSSNVTRNTGSAYSAAGVLSYEPGDPIIRETHYLVQNLLTEMEQSGSSYDRTNSAYIYDSLPTWIREEDEKNNNIKYLYQILSSYLDTLYVQISELPKLKDKNYFSASAEPYPFVEKFLNDRGLITPNSFVDGDIIEYFWDRNEHGVHYEQSIEKTKRLIYNNIYNNLDFILKSKGTEKSFRNLLRCYGIDDELVKLNVYTDNGKHYIKDRYKNSSIKTKVLNLNNASRTGGSVIQTSSSLNPRTFFSGSGAEQLEKFSAFSMEAGVIFPKGKKFEETGYFLPQISASLFGFNQAVSGANEHYGWNVPNDANLQVYAVRAARDSDRVKFVFKNQDDSIYAESGFIEEVYNAERWNFQLSVKPAGYPFIGNEAFINNPNYEIELYGVNHNLGEIRNQFTIAYTASNPVGVQIMTQPKRVYLGAHRQDFTGSVISQCDVMFDSCRVWMDELEKESIRQHNLDPMNYGHDKIYNATTIFNNTISSSVHIPGGDSLMLHWNFDQNSSADATGSFIVEDFSSGSLSNMYSWASNTVEREHKGRGVGFPNNDPNAVKSEFIFARRKELPEISFTDNRIKIIGKDDELFIEDEDTTDNIFALEKSMYQTISEEMIRTFSTMKEYSNLFAKPVDHYRMEYKRLRKAREMFFNRVESDTDLDRYVEYFKWIDSSLSFFIEQLKPASVTFTKGISDVVESHIFERPKYARKFPTVKTIQATQGTISSLGELSYNWKFGHSPEYKGGGENTHCLWQRERRERTGPASTQRKAINDTIITNAESYNVYLGDDQKNVYLRQTYTIRRFSRPYKLEMDLNTSLHGGTNYNIQKNRDFVYNVTRPHGSKTNIGIPVNVFVVGVGPGQGITETRMCDDEESPTQLKKLDFTMTAGKDSSLDGLAPASASLDYVYQVKGHYAAPFTLISGTMPHGANRKISQGYTSSAIVTNLHSDTTYFENDVPMQGTFSETWMGGHQSRHVELNRYDESLISSGGVATRNYLDDEYTRPEAFRILVGEHPDETNQDGALGFVGPDYGGPYPDTSRQWAIHYRGMRGKTPYTFGNVSGSERMLGNYNRRYEYFNTVGRLENNNRLKKAASDADYQLSGTFLPAHIQEALPATTNPISLIGAYPLNLGNVFGIGESNRINAVNQVLRHPIAASGSFNATGSTLYQAPYSASFEIQSIPHAGTHQAYNFVVTGATDFYEIYTASFGVQGVPHAGAHQTYYFESQEETSNITYNNYVGSFDIEPIPVAGQSPTLSWIVKDASSLTDGHQLRITASGVDKLIEVDTTFPTSVRGDTDITVGTKINSNQGLHIDDTHLYDTNMYNVGSNQGYTVSFWAKIDTGDIPKAGNSTLFALRTPTTNELVLWAFINNMGYMVFRVYFGDAGDYLNLYAQRMYDVRTFDDDTWRHYVFSTGPSNPTFNNIASHWNGFVRVNGSLLTTFSTADSLSSNYDKDDILYYADKLYIGDESGAGNRGPDITYKDFGLWAKALTSTEADEIYNGGNYFDHTTHSRYSFLRAFYTFSDASDSTSTINCAIAPANDLTVDNSSNVSFAASPYPEPVKTNVQIWDSLKSTLNSAFTGWTANYHSRSNGQAQFFLRKDSAGVDNNWGLYSTNTNSFSFPASYATMGSSSVASNMEDFAEISISGSTFYTLLSDGYVGESGNYFRTATGARKAIYWYPTSTKQMYIYNDSNFSIDNSQYQTISFWHLNTNTSNDNRTVMEWRAAGGNMSLWIKFNSANKILIQLFDTTSNYYYWRSTTVIPLQRWTNYTIVFDKTLMNVAPSLWINGSYSSLVFESAGTGGTTAAPILNPTRIYVGDTAANDAAYELDGGRIQDLAIWNYSASAEDAAYSYNSGSWLDLTAHPKAHYISHWWLFGSEPALDGYSITNNIHAATSLAPAIGTCTLETNSALVFGMQRGVKTGSKSASTFHSNITARIEAVTNYTASNSSNTIQINTHAHSVPTADSFANTSDTYTNESAIAFDAFAFDNYVAGATSGSYIEIQDKKFYVSTGSVPATYASSGTERVLVNSTSSNWPVYLRDAIQEHLPEYTASYYTHGGDYHFFVRSGELGAKGDNTLTEDGDTFSNLGKVLGNAASASSTLAHGDTITIESDTFTTNYTTIYPATSKTFQVANTHRKGLQWQSNDNAYAYIQNTSYANPDASAVSISFWIKYDQISAGVEYILNFTDSSDQDAILLKTVNDDLTIRVKQDGSGAVEFIYYNILEVDVWKHYTIVVNKTALNSVVFYIDGEVVSGTRTGNQSGTLTDIEKVYIGDKDDNNVGFEVLASLQDFVIWNTELNSQDATILYNSGSWLDVHSHPSASSIWDWWMLGEEAGMPSPGGGHLDANGVTSIAPTIGRHSLTVSSQAGEYLRVTYGIAETKKTTPQFKTHIASIIAAANTDYNTYVSSVNLEITSAFTTYGGTFTEEGETYTIDGPIVLARYGNYHTGAVDENQITFEGKTFVVTASTNPSGAYETYGNEVHVFSHKDTNEGWWNNLTTAIEATLPQMTATYFEHDGEAHFFVRSGSADDSAHTTIQETGVSFSALHMTSGSAASGSSTLADQDTLTIVDNTGTHVFKVGHSTSGSTDINTGATFRKALRFKDKGSSNLNHAKNVSYTNPTSTDYLSISWWMQIPDIDSNQERIWEFDHGSGNHSVARIQNQYIEFFLFDDGGSNSVTYRTNNSYYSSADIGIWKHYTFVFSRTNADAQTPLLYVNGVPTTLTLNTSATWSNTNVVPITKVYIGDDDASGQVQQDKGLQDFVIWNTQLAEVDAQILYNSGSWLDIHSHPKANLIWDWWMLGNEPEITQEFDSALSSTTNGAAVTTIAPTVGRHSLTFSDNTQVFVTSGSMEVGKTNAAFWAEMTQSVKDTSEFNTEYTVSSTATQYNVTASTAVTGALMAVGSGDTLPTVQASFARDGTTFNIARQVFRGADVLTHQRYANAGANPDDFLIVGPNSVDETASTLFITDISGGVASTSAPYYTKVAPRTRGVINWLNTNSKQRNDLYNESFALESSATQAVSFWIKKQSANQSSYDDYILVLRYNSNNALQIYYDNAHQFIRFRIDGTGGEKVHQLDTSNYNHQEWHHITFVYNKNDMEVVPTVYKDGILQSLSLFQGSGTGAMYTPNRIYVGDYPSTSVAYENHGFLSDLVIWNTSLNSEDASILYNGGFWYDLRLHASASSITDWWLLGEEATILEKNFDGHTLRSRGITTLPPRIGTHSLTTPTDGYQYYNNSARGTGLPDRNTYYYIFSSASSDDEYWLRISGAMFDAYNKYSVVSSSGNPNPTLFRVTGSLEVGGVNIFDVDHVNNRALTIYGTNFTNPVNIAGGLDQVVQNDTINVIEKESDFLSGSERNKTVITSRFSAPGGIETQTYGYLDAYAREYSPHNHLNYRNLTVRGSGSGENGTIRVNSQTNNRDGLRALYQRAMGHSGVDSVYGIANSSDYEYSASFHKVPRNTRPSLRDGLSTKPSRALNSIGAIINNEILLGSISNTPYPISGPIAISFWIKLDHLVQSGNRIFDSGALEIFLNGGALSIYIKDNGGLQRSHTWNDIRDQLDEWSNIVITHDGVDNDVSPTLYLNGNSQGAADTSAGHGGLSTTRGEFGSIVFFDSKATLGGYRVTGSLQDVAIWNKHLDSSDVSQIYGAGDYFNLLRHQSVDSLLDYWRFGEEIENLSIQAGSQMNNLFIQSIAGGKTTLSSNGPLAIADGYYQIQNGIKDVKNNYNYNSVIPSSDYNYSWATSSLGDNYSVRSGNQKVFGYWPKDGLNRVNGVLVSAITFPSSSEIYATYGE